MMIRIRADLHHDLVPQEREVRAIVNHGVFEYDAVRHPNQSAVIQIALDPATTLHHRSVKWRDVDYISHDAADLNTFTGLI